MSQEARWQRYSPTMGGAVPPEQAYGLNSRTRGAMVLYNFIPVVNKGLLGKLDSAEKDCM